MSRLAVASGALGEARRALARAVQPAVRLMVSPTGRLAASYLAVIVVMSLGFSIVLYSVSAGELQRQLPPPSLYQLRQGQDQFQGQFQQPDGYQGLGNDSGPVISSPQAVNEFIRIRIQEGRQALLMRLLFLNVCTLLAGAALSYYLARRTLQPIEASIEAQSQFVSDASHELRTPLTTLQTGNEVALRDRQLTLPKARDLLQQNIEEVTKLQALTDALLRLARQDADAAALPAEPVSLQDIAGEAMNRVVTQAQAKGIAVDETVPAVMAVAHADSLVQALVILLDNAIKYSPDDAVVRIEGGRRAKQVYITVTDQGPGVRVTEQQRIFDRFYRSDRSRSGQHVPGHGIGLALARKIVEQQHGTLGWLRRLRSRYRQPSAPGCAILGRICH